jgi:hypothetical protein
MSEIQNFAQGALEAIEAAIEPEDLMVLDYFAWRSAFFVTDRLLGADARSYPGYFPEM